MDDGAPSCDWIMKVPVSSYVNVPTLQARLGCFNATEMFFLGAPTVAYSAGGAWGSGGVMDSRGRNNRNCAADLCLVRIFVLTEKTQEEEFYG